MNAPDFIAFGKPILSDDEIAAVSETLRSGWIGTGPRSKEFETAFASYQGAGQAAAVSSCTTALNLCLSAFGIGEGAEVIVPAMTFAASVNAVIHCGARPVLADVEPRTFTIDPASVERVITPRTRAILPVHFAGAPADVDALATLRDRHRLKLIHDCAHAIETEWNGARLGPRADVACFSFYSTKNITAIEGGMVCSEDAELVERVRLLSNHGMSKDAWKRFSPSGYQHYDIVAPGFKYNFTDVQASLGLKQLAKIEVFAKRRMALWRRYGEALSSLPLALPNDVAPPHRHARHLYTLLVDRERAGLGRDELLAALHARGIGCGVHYRSIPELSCYRKTFGWKPEDFPVSASIGARTLSIPFTQYLTDAEADRVIAAVTEALRSP